MLQNSPPFLLTLLLSTLQLPPPQGTVIPEGFLDMAPDQLPHPESALGVSLPPNDGAPVVTSMCHDPIPTRCW